MCSASAAARVGRFSGFYKLLRQGNGLVRDVQGWYVTQDLRSPLSGISVASGRFGDYELGYAYLERRATKRPPLVRELLARRGNQVPTRASRQIADDRGFEIDALNHGGSLAQSRLEPHAGVARDDRDLVTVAGEVAGRGEPDPAAEDENLHGTNPSGR